MMDWQALESWLLVRGGADGTGWAASTVEQRMGDLRRAETWGMDVEDFDQDDGDRFLASLRRDGITPEGLENYVVALNALARYHGLEHRWAYPDRPKRQKTYLDDDEIAQLLTYQHDDPILHRRDRAELVVALQTALRPSEAYCLGPDAFDREEHTIHVEKTSKHGIRRRIPVEPWVLSPKRPLGAYLDWLADMDLDDHDTIWLSFPNDRFAGPRLMGQDYFRDRLRQIGETVAVQVNWQITRRSRATQLLDEGWPLPYVSRYLGHNDVSTTQEYLGISEAKMIDMMGAKAPPDPTQRSQD
jgi:site-specific recombinase XerD